MAASLALLAAACGSGEDTLDASSDDGASTDTSVDENTSDESTPADDEPPNPSDDGSSDSNGNDSGSDNGSGEAGQPVAGDSDYAPTLAMLDITGPTAHPIDEVVVADDGMTIGVRYQAAAEPCSGAIAEVVEDDAAITVTLQTGLNPEAATMSCIAEVMLYELAVGLDAPVGDREIVLPGSDDDDSAAPDSAAPDSDGSDSGSDDGDNDAVEDSDGLSSPESFIGMSLDDASAKAEAEGRGWRISRQDEEQFGLTADYDADRVTFEVDAGVVTAAGAG